MFIRLKPVPVGRVWTRRGGRAALIPIAALTILIQTAPLGRSQDVPESKLHIIVIEGDGAMNNLKQRVAREPIVQVEDENRKPVAGIAVTFILPAIGASGTFGESGGRVLTVVTDESGRAVARGLIPNEVEGSFEIRVVASREGQTVSTSIRQVNSVSSPVASNSSANSEGGANSASQAATPGRAVGMPAAKGMSLATKLIIVAGVAGAAAAGGVVINQRSSSSGSTLVSGPPATPSVTITLGPPRVGAPGR